MAAKRILIIGAVALGPKAACRLKRLRPDMQVTMLDQGEFISYGGCGIPYYISGDLSDIKELLSTSFHMLRTRSSLPTPRTSACAPAPGPWPWTTGAGRC